MKVRLWVDLICHQFVPYHYDYYQNPIYYGYYDDYGYWHNYTDDWGYPMYWYNGGFYYY